MRVSRASDPAEPEPKLYSLRLFRLLKGTVSSNPNVCFETRFDVAGSSVVTVSILRGSLGGAVSEVPPHQLTAARWARVCSTRRNIVVPFVSKTSVLYSVPSLQAG